MIFVSNKFIYEFKTKCWVWLWKLCNIFDACVNFFEKINVNVIPHVVASSKCAIIKFRSTWANKFRSSLNYFLSLLCSKYILHKILMTLTHTHNINYLRVGQRLILGSSLDWKRKRNIKIMLLQYSLLFLYIQKRKKN